MPVTAAAATPTAARSPCPAATAAAAGRSLVLATPAGGYFIVIGFPIGIDERNCDRRARRELWYPEYDNIGKTVRVEFVIGC